MHRKPCQHKIILPSGLRCNHGYLEVLLKVKGQIYCRTFKQHTRETQQIAEIHLSEKRKEILMNKFDMSPPMPRKKFPEVADIWFKHWKLETESDGKPSHAERSIEETERVLDKVFKPLFADYWFDEIRPIQIERWREEGLRRGLAGTSLNRYQAVLSSIFSKVDRWIKTERIKPEFQVPENNPSLPVEKAPTVKRMRVLTKYEASKLRLAFMTLKDFDGWEICKMALKSILSEKDLRNLDLGQEIDIERAKTGVPVNLPVPVLVKLNWYNWRHRWEAARKEAGLENVQFRDLRKTGINWLKGRHELKLVSEYAGHADIKTTEKSYTIKQAEYLEPLAKDLDAQVEAL
jgi:integrase